MEFRQLNLKAFGCFEDFNLDFEGPARFHLIYGPNEAGKSTTLAAISGLLYGIDSRTRYAFRHDMADLRIGATLRWRQGWAA